MAKPFKVPIAGYDNSYSARALGMRRSGIRVALHDPYEEGALILFEPPALSEHEKLKLDRYKGVFYYNVELVFLFHCKEIKFH